MFKLFPLDFRENPYISIKLGNSCPASCDACRYSSKYVRNVETYSLENIFEVVDECDKKFEKDFDIVFGNLSSTSHPYIIDILKYGIAKWRKVRFQLGFHLNKNDLMLLKKVENELGHNDIQIKIAKNCNDSDDWKKDLFVLIKLLTSFTKFKFYIDIFLDIEKNETYITSLLKHSTSTQNEHQHNFCILDMIDVKFHDYSWKVCDDQKTILDLKMRKTCQHLDQIYCEDGDVFAKDSVDVFENGDMMIHDNLCNIGDLMVSNIFFDEKRIYTDFEKYILRLKGLEKKHKNQWDMCYDCIKKSYHYNK